MDITHAVLAVLLLGGSAVQVPPTQHISVKLASDATEVAPGGTIRLSVEIQPDSKMAVFAAGSSEFKAVTLTLTSYRDVKVGRTKYPLARRKENPGNRKRVPLYDGAFTIEQPIIVSAKAKPGDVVNVIGFLRYQTCDDKIVYPEKRVPVRWAITVKAPSQ